MTTQAPGGENPALHPTVQAKIEAMQKARRQELAELRGSALGFAESQVALQAEGEAYLKDVVCKVNEVFIRRQRYLDNVPLALMAFPSWLFLVIATIAWLVTSLFRGPLIAGEPIFHVTLGFVILLQATIHFSIGFKALWHELCRYKWAWLIGVSFILFCSFITTRALIIDSADDVELCSQSNHDIRF